MYCYPLPQEYPVSSPYGNRAGGFHDGIDFACPTGTPVLAFDNSKVVFAGADQFGGLFVDLQQGNIKCRYLHLNKINVQLGQEVTKGQEIGLSGNTGQSTGSHLHFGYFVNGKSQNPEIILNNSTTNNINPMDKQLIQEFANGNFNSTELLNKAKEANAGGAEVTGQILIDYQDSAEAYLDGRLSLEELAKNPIFAGLALRIKELSK
jgi:hypothetical protein